MPSAKGSEVYVIREGKNGWVSLDYEYREKGRQTDRKTIGRVNGWRKQMFLNFAKQLDVRHETDSFMTSVRLSLFIIMLPKMKDTREALRLKRAIMDLWSDDIAFWYWKFIGKSKNNAIKSFRAMYKV